MVFQTDGGTKPCKPFCFLRNVVDIRADCQTAYKARYKEDFRGPIIPFGAGIRYKPSRHKDIADMAKIGNKMEDGVFAGYAQHAGGGWAGDVYVIDAFEMTNAESYRGLYTKRVSADEITIEKKTAEFTFPVLEHGWEQPSDGSVKMTRRTRKAERIVIPDDSEADDEEESRSGGKVRTDR